MENLKSFIIIAGEVSINDPSKINYEDIARTCCLNIGYSDINYGMDASDEDLCEVIILVGEQSDEISQGVTPEKAYFSGMEQATKESCLVMRLMNQKNLII